MITRRTLLIATAASVAGCGDDDKVPMPQPRPPGITWEIGPVIGGQNHSIGMPATMTPRPDGGFEFEFPGSSGAVHYVFRSPTVGEARTSIKMRYRIEGGGAGFTAVDGGVPAMVRLFIQRRDDTWAGQGSYASYRFWSAPKPLADGEHVLEGPIVGWTNVQGQQDEPGLQAALADLGAVGFTFGSTFAGHGVYANAPGAKFILMEYAVQ